MAALPRCDILWVLNLLGAVLGYLIFLQRRYNNLSNCRVVVRQFQLVDFVAGAGCVLWDQDVVDAQQWPHWAESAAET